jgi:hypothetical protein
MGPKRTSWAHSSPDLQSLFYTHTHTHTKACRQAGPDVQGHLTRTGCQLASRLVGLARRLLRGRTGGVRQGQPAGPAEGPDASCQDAPASGGLARCPRGQDQGGATGARAEGGKQRWHVGLH